VSGREFIHGLRAGWVVTNKRGICLATTAASSSRQTAPAFTHGYGFRHPIGVRPHTRQLKRLATAGRVAEGRIETKGAGLALGCALSLSKG
ncbi:MAG: hypothetical protein ACE5HA_06030, partial [Anaerolineae bacterium]